MSSVFAAAFSAFIAAFLLFEASPTRATLNWGQKQKSRQYLIRFGAAALLGLSLWLLISLMGALRGVPVWIGFLMAFNLSCLMIANWRTRLHHIFGVSAGTLLFVALAAKGLGAV